MGAEPRQPDCASASIYNIWGRLQPPPCRSECQPLAPSRPIQIPATSERCAAIPADSRFRASSKQPGQPGLCTKPVTAMIYKRRRMIYRRAAENGTQCSQQEELAALLSGATNVSNERPWAPQDRAQAVTTREQSDHQAQYQAALLPWPRPCHLCRHRVGPWRLSH
jgi:hypothetical protein